MAAIHLIKKTSRKIPGIDKVSDDPTTYTSGFWTLSEEKARLLIGGCIYFHEHQSDPSYFGGRIVGCERQADGEYMGKIVFRFESSVDCRGIRTERSGWSQEMKLDGTMK